MAQLLPNGRVRVKTGGTRKSREKLAQEQQRSRPVGDRRLVTYNGQLIAPNNVSQINPNLGFEEAFDAQSHGVRTFGSTVWPNMPEESTVKQSILGLEGQPVIFARGQTPDEIKTKEGLNATINDSVNRLKFRLVHNYFQNANPDKMSVKHRNYKYDKKGKVTGLSAEGYQLADNMLKELGLSDTSSKPFIIGSLSEDQKFVQDYMDHYQSDFPDATIGAHILGANQRSNLKKGKFTSLRGRSNMGRQNDHYYSPTDVADYLYEKYFSSSRWGNYTTDSAKAEAKTLWEKAHSRDNYSGVPAPTNTWMGGLGKMFLRSGQDMPIVGALGPEMGGINVNDSVYESERMPLHEQHWNVPEADEFKDWHTKNIHKNQARRVGRVGKKTASNAARLASRIMSVGDYMDPSGAILDSNTFNTPTRAWSGGGNAKIMSTDPSGGGARASTLGGRNWPWAIGTKVK